MASYSSKYLANKRGGRGREPINTKQKHRKTCEAIQNGREDTSEEGSEEYHQSLSSIGPPPLSILPLIPSDQTQYRFTRKDHCSSSCGLSSSSFHSSQTQVLLEMEKIE